jgi:hypothetical protein
MKPLVDHAACRRKKINQGLQVVSAHDPDRDTGFGALVGFGQQVYECFTARADALFELTDAV